MKLLIFLLAIVFSTNVLASETETQNYEAYYQDFLVSAYYSPLPGQVKYVRGSYEADMRLNGRGTNGADGTPVFEGMLAAPKSYNFGTRIGIPGLCDPMFWGTDCVGIGIVHDRGGAIIEKEDYHRIDVWMGHGDEGRIRAQNWGMRYVIGKVFFEKNIQTTLDYDVVPVKLTANMKKQKPIITQPKIIQRNLALNSIGTQVVQLKKVLQKLEYFTGEIDNDYFDEELRKAVINFQIDQKIIVTKNSYGSGFVGLKTRTALQKVVDNKKIDIPQVVKNNFIVDVKTGLKKDAKGIEVKKLQWLLSSLGYYDNQIDGVYSKNTEAAVFALQKDNHIVKNSTDPGSGVFGPKTKNILEKIVKEKITTLNQLPVEKSEIFVGEKISPKKQKIYISQNQVKFPAVKFGEINTKILVDGNNKNMFAGQNISKNLIPKAQIIE